MPHDHTTAADGALFVFVGHSDDADDEAEAIMELGPDLQRDFDGLAGVSGSGCPFHRLAMWEWSADAPSLTGGQAGVIAPATRRAHVGVFVFKERVGSVTRDELDDLRSRAAEGVHVIAFFPENAPPPERFGEEGVGTRWDELLRLRRELTADWTDADSRSVTPHPPYRDRAHLKQMARDAIRRAMAEHLQAAPRASAPATVLPALVERAPGTSFDHRRVLRHGLADLDGGLIDHYLARPLSQAPVRRGGHLVRLSPTERLEHLGLLREGQPTVGAFLCFAPARLLAGTFASCRLHRVQYGGNTRETPVQIQPAADNLLNLFEEGMAWLTTQAGLRRTGRVGSRDRDELEVPEIALREALANALVHREYSRSGFRDQPTRIEVFDDRVEITSYGELSPMVPVELLNDPPEDLKPVRRNPLVAEIFLHMAYAELNASGVVRMHRAMEEAGLPAPELVYDRQQGVVIVRLRRPGPDTGKPLRIFVSWSAQNLEQHGAVLLNAVRQLGANNIRVAAVPGDHDAPEASRTELAARADILIAIVHEKYDPGTGILEEVRAAREAHVPVAAFLTRRGGSDEWYDRLYADPARQHQAESEMRFRSLRKDLLQSVVVSRVDGSRSLESGVFEAIMRVHRASRSGAGKRPWRPFFTHPRPIVRAFEGRTELLQYLIHWMLEENPMQRVVCLAGMGGMGKSTLAERALAAVEGQHPGGIFQWSFYEEPSSAAFLHAAAEYFTGEAGAAKGESLNRLRDAFAGKAQHLMVLDGLERVQANGHEGRPRGSISAPELRHLLRFLTGASGRARALVTSRLPLADLEDWKNFGYRELYLPPLPTPDAREVLRHSGMRGNDAELDELANRVWGHPLALGLLAHLASVHEGDPASVSSLDLNAVRSEPRGARLAQIFSDYAASLGPHERRLLSRMAQHPAGLPAQEMSPMHDSTPPFAERLQLLDGLVKLGIVTKSGELYAVHPLIREYLRTRPEAPDEEQDADPGSSPFGAGGS